MSYNSKPNLELHHFEICVPEDATTLIVGTFPTHKRNYEKTFAFYYGSKDNNFWNVITRIFNHRFIHFEGDLAKQERINFLNEKGIGITDMIAECYRFGKSSSDTSLFPIKLTDVISILKKHNSITKIILTSRSGAISSLGLFKVHLNNKKINPINFTKNKNGVLEGVLDMHSREIKILVPYSTSPKVVKDNRNNITQNEIDEMYRFCLT
jgi:G:T/U-mismatch repair DNA glycosylase